MKVLHALGLSLLLPLVLGCSAVTSEEPQPVIPAPRVYVHYQLTGGKDAFITFKLQIHPQLKPYADSDAAWYSVIKNVWEVKIPVQLGPHEQLDASVRLPGCGSVKQTFPVGATIVGELIVDGIVQQKTVFTATPSAVTPPEWIPLSLSFDDLK
jgi:hypothetical protein